MRRTPVIRHSWVFALVLVVFVSTAPTDAMSKKEQAALDKANREWSGASCRTRLPIEVKKPKKNDWTKCKPIFYTEQRGNERVKVSVSDGAAVHRAFYGGVIPPGTEVKAVGWSASKGGDNLCLELELAGHPVRLKVFYGADWGEIGIGRMDEFERWAKYDFLDVISNPSEGLVEVPVSAGADPRPPVTRPASPSASTGPPVVKIDAVAVQPARIAAGASTELIVTYTVGGVPAGATFEVAELREIFLGEQRIASFEERLRRTDGTHPSRQSLTIPAGTAPGVYTLRATLVMAGREVAGSALFEVTAP